MKDKPYDNSRCFVDTNVWLYSFIQSQDADKSLASKAILKGNDIIISTQIVNEMCVNLIKKAKFSEEKIQGQYCCSERIRLRSRLFNFRGHAGWF